MVAYIFDRDSFFNTLRSMCADFPLKCQLYQSVGTRFTWSYIVQQGPDTYAIMHTIASPKTSASVQFYYERDSNSLLSGTYDLNTDTFTFFSAIERDRLLSGTENMDAIKFYATLREGIGACLGSLRGCMLAHLKSYHIVPWPSLEQPDLVAALDDCFDKYSSFDATPRRNKKYTVSAHRDNTLVRITYKEDMATHNEIDVMVDNKIGRFIKRVYQFQYSYTSGGAIEELGIKLDGFDEGFAKFKLLGALMT